MKAEININLDNIAYNFEKIRASTSCQNIIPVLKANAYNIGIYNVVSTLLNIKNPQNKYFVFAPVEGIELRKMFPKLDRIFILGGIFKGEEEYFKNYNLTPVINNFEQLELCKKSKINEVVLQFDTGFNRSGVPSADAKKVRQFTDTYNIKVLLVMSHFCFANNIIKPINQKQISKFKKIISYFPEKTIEKSLSASDGILSFNLQDICDSYRPGLMLYGFYEGFKCAYSIYSVINSERDDIFLPLGIENGLTSEYGKSRNYIFVDEKKVYIKSIEKNRVILDTINKKLVGKKAEILGDNISMKAFEEMSGTDIRDIVARIISNCDKDSKNFKINTERKRIEVNFPVKIQAKKDNEFTSTLIEKRIVEEDGVVGYSATENVKKYDKLGVILGGYLDGIFRGISNKKCSVFVENKNRKLVECEIFARISMDQTIIKIPEKEFKNIEIGTKVIIFDKNHPVERFEKATGKSKEELFFYLDKSSRVKTFF